jgi:hypothetical protein
MIPLTTKSSKPRKSKKTHIVFLDSEGYEVHRIGRSFDENKEPGFDGRWHYKDAYLENNRVWITKWDEKEERKVSYPIKKTNKYFVEKSKTKIV